MMSRFAWPFKAQSGSNAFYREEVIGADRIKNSFKEDGPCAAGGDCDCGDCKERLHP